MKRTLILLLQAAAVLLLTAACQADLLTEQDETLISDPSAPIKLKGSAPISVNGAVTRAEQEIKFSLTAVLDRYGYGAIPHFTNVIATLPSSSNEPQNISFSTHYWPLNGKQLQFIGIMNGKGEAVNIIDNGSAGKLYIESGPGIEKDILMSDNLIGNKTGFTNTIQYMRFKHLTARLTIKPGKVVRRVTCDISGGTEMNTYLFWGKEFTVNLMTPYTISYDTNNGEQTYYLVPNSSSYEYNKITELTNVTIDGKSRYDPIKITDDTGKEASLDIAAGKSYTIVISSEAAKLMVSSSPTIDTTWEDGGIIN
nr:hypothetical protein [Bacteroides intestinalis]